MPTRGKQARSTGTRRKVAVPEAGLDRRAWIRHELSKRENAETGARYNQAAIAAEAGVSETLVSNVLLGRREAGKASEKVMRVVARVLEMTTDELFGIALVAGDGYPGSKGAV